MTSNFEMCFFLREDIYRDNTKKSHGIVNIMEHDRVAGFRNTANLSREYKIGAAITLYRLIEG